MMAVTSNIQDGPPMSPKDTAVPCCGSATAPSKFCAKKGLEEVGHSKF